MTDNKNVDNKLETIFKLHLTKQYEKGLKEGLVLGSKLFLQAVLDLINDNKSLDDIKKYCESKLS